MSLYLQNVKMMPSSAAGLVLISQPLVMALISPFAGGCPTDCPHKLPRPAWPSLPAACPAQHAAGGFPSEHLSGWW
jgi:hypothetical protein